MLMLIRELVAQVWALELGVWLAGQHAFVDFETRENSMSTFLAIDSASQWSADRCLARAQMVHEQFLWTNSVHGYASTAISPDAQETFA